MDYQPFNVQQYSYQLLYSLYRRKTLVLAIILLSTVIIVASSQFSNSPINKNSKTVYEEQSQFLEADNRYERFKDVNLSPKILNENDHQDQDSAQNDHILTNRLETEVKNANENLVAAQITKNNKKYVPEFRIVHFDLKGAPPKISYMKKVLHTIKEAGANGILLEYEDMFPFEEPISEIAAKNHYTKDEISEIISICKELNLELIPLIQTFGHLEFSLKLSKFRFLREIDRFPTAVCPSKTDSFDKLIQPIVDQVIYFHKQTGHELKYIHIGCDEVFHIGSCDLCHGKDRDDLFLHHVKKIASYVKMKHQVQPIIWDDMIRNIYSEKIKQYDLGKFVEIMIWSYIKDIYRFIPYSTFDQFAEIFPAIWAASSFKGAYGETLTVPNVEMHLENNLGWLETLSEQANKFKIRGLVLTGWQRYDHLAVLCELFPPALPSLITNLITVTNGEFDYADTMSKFDQIMNCSKISKKMSMRIYGNSDKESTSLLGKDPFLFARASPCQWSGVTLFRLMQQLSDLIKRTNDYIYDVNIHKAWLTDYNFRRNYSNPYRIDEGLNEYSSLRYQYIGIMQTANQFLNDFFDKYTTAEWIEQNIYSYVLKLDHIYNESKRIYEVREWENRPLKPLKELEKFGIKVD